MNNKLKYKLIKEYPGSPDLGCILKYDNECDVSADVKYYPEFWEKVEGKNWVILGTVVMRLPDRVKFKLGDKVYNPKCPTQKFTIEKFYLDCEGRHMLVGPGHVGIHKIEHYKEPLLKDEFGNELFERDVFWFVDFNFEMWQGLVCDSNIRKNVKHFKFRKDAEKYINENKPKFSKKDLLDFIINAKIFFSYENIKYTEENYIFFAREWIRKKKGD